jgi:hypothetical protein
MASASAQQDNSKISADAALAENGHDPTSNPGEDEWDEERLEKAMNTLKEMHIQVGIRWSIAVGLLLISLIASWVTDHNPKAHRTSDNQATVTYVLKNLLQIFYYQLRCIHCKQ